jgi:hypothetical protein
LRQAYDYWQDQPGNYFPTRFRGHRLLACVKALAFTMQSSSIQPTYPDPPQLKGAFSLHVRRGTTNLKPASDVTSFPTLTCLKQDPPVLQGAEVTTFDEGYLTTGPPKRHTRSWRILKGLNCIRFDHRQSIHLLQQSSKAHPTEDGLETLWPIGLTNPHQGSTPLRASIPHLVAGLFDTTRGDPVNH